MCTHPSEDIVISQRMVYTSLKHMQTHYKEVESHGKDISRR